MAWARSFCGKQGCIMDLKSLDLLEKECRTSPDLLGKGY